MTKLWNVKVTRMITSEESFPFNLEIPDNVGNIHRNAW